MGYIAYDLCISFFTIIISVEFSNISPFIREIQLVGLFSNRKQLETILKKEQKKYIIQVPKHIKGPLYETMFRDTYNLYQLWIEAGEN